MTEVEGGAFYIKYVPEYRLVGLVTMEVHEEKLHERFHFGLLGLRKSHTHFPRFLSVNIDTYSVQAHSTGKIGPSSRLGAVVLWRVEG